MDAHLPTFHQPTDEIFVVYSWQFIEYRYVPSHAFATSEDAWTYVREQIDAGKDMSRFRVIAREADPDLEAMVTRPAATTAGSVSLLEAVKARAA